MGWSTNPAMEPRSGLEPETSSLPWMRSTNWAIAALLGILPYEVRTSKPYCLGSWCAHFASTLTLTLRCFAYRACEVLPVVSLTSYSIYNWAFCAILNGIIGEVIVHVYIILLEIHWQMGAFVATIHIVYRSSDLLSIECLYDKVSC